EAHGQALLQQRCRAEVHSRLKVIPRWRGSTGLSGALLSEATLHDAHRIGVIDRVCRGHSGSDDKGLPQRPCPPALPPCLVKLQGGSNRIASLAIEPGPCDREIARRIADSEVAEVDDGDKFSCLRQQIAGPEIAVDPDGRPSPACRESGPPHFL